jgi:hypothetical protein
MSALQGQVDQWFTDNPNATGQQIVDVIKSVGGLDAHAGLTDILASRYGVAPNEVTNYYNTYATPASALTADIANTPGMGAQGIGVNTASAAPNSYFTANPDVAAAFQQNSYGMTPEQFAATHYQNFGANEQRAAPTMGALSQVANIRGDDAMPHPNDDDPSAIINTYKSIYGVDPTQEQLAGLTQQFGSEFDPSEVARFVYDDTSLRDDPRGAVKTLQQQILDQGFTGKWSGEGFGSAEANAADMARMLASAGITDINQFGKVNVAADAAVTPVYGTRKAFDPEYGEYEERYVTGYTDASGKAVDPSLVRADEELGYIAPVGTKEVFGNKTTGIALDPRYDRAQGNIFSGTFAGKGSTGYGVQFREDGTPVFYTQFGGSTNTVKQIMDDLGPLGQVAFAVATGGLSIPQQIAAQAALQLASGAEFKDVAKGIAVNAIMQGLPTTGVIKDGASFLNTVDSSGVLGNMFTGAASSGVKAALTNKDIGDAVLSGAIGGGTAGAIDFVAGSIPGFSDLSRSQQNMVKNAISGVTSGQPLDQVLINTAISAGKNAVRSATRTGGLPTAENTGAGATSPLADAEDSIDLPSGIQTASLDGGLPTRVEVSGTPIFADSGRAANVRPPAGYTLASTTDEVMNEPARYDDNDRMLPKSDGTYYDVTQNAWFKPTGEFDAATNVQDYSNLFGGSQANLTDADLAAIRGEDSGLGADVDFDYIGGLGGNPTKGQGGLDFAGGTGSPADDLGTIEIVGNRPPADDLGTIEIVGDRIPSDDLGTIEIVGERPVDDDLGTIEIVGDRLKDDVITSDTATTPPGTTTTTVKPTVVTPKTTTTKTTKKTSNTSMPSSLESSITTTPQVLRGAAREKAMRLAALRQLFDSLTPEMQEILMERGITAPAEQNPDEKSEKELLEKSSENLSPKIDDQGVTTKFFAGGGTITELQGMKDRFNPNLRTTPSMLAAAPIDPKEPPLKLAGLRHLRQGIAKPPKPISELAQGGLPQKYAQAAPEGHKPEFITGLTGYYASGKGTGQSDDIPAMLHDGDYVIDADAVAAFGDGSSKAGAQALSQFQSKVPHQMGTGGKAVAAKIADGEYVFPEAFVSALGGGSNEKGAKMLDAMREELRAHKRSAPTSKIPPKAKSPLDYLRMAKG